MSGPGHAGRLPPEQLSPEALRARMIAGAQKTIADIDQLDIDCDYWNRNHPDEEPLQADPDGQMAVLREWAVRLLEKVGVYDHA